MERIRRFTCNMPFEVRKFRDQKVKPKPINFGSRGITVPRIVGVNLFWENRNKIMEILC